MLIQPTQKAVRLISGVGEKFTRKNEILQNRIYAKYVKRWKNIYQKPVCLAQENCSNKDIGRCHTVSKASSLKYIAEENHLFVRQVNLYAKSDKDLLRVKKLSINEALAFKGFCNEHDRNLFRSLDNSQFIASPEQLFMQAYRCVCREVYFKACQIALSLSAEQIAEIQGLPDDKDYKLTSDIGLMEQAKIKGLDDILKCKEKFESLLKCSEFIRLRSFVCNLCRNDSCFCMCRGLYTCISFKWRGNSRLH